MTSPKAKRDRGRILTEKGWQKISNAIYKQLGDGYTLEAVSELTSRATNPKAVDFVSKDTVSNILKRRAPADKGKIEALFSAFGLKLEPDDHTSANSYPHQDWGEAPDVSTFYGRSDELIALAQWIVKERCRLVAILGMAGIGKTALSVKLAKQTQEDFGYVIWRSIKDAPPVQELLANLIEFLSNQQETKANLPENIGSRVSRLIEYLRRRRCLLVLDGVESILQEGNQAGHYPKKYEGYGELLRQVGESNHQSCLVLTSREKPREIALLAGKTLPVRALQLEGLQEEAAKEILKVKDLAEPNQWGELIKRYGGNPFALKLVSTTIKTLFEGNIYEFLKLNTLFLGDFNELLDQQFYRLSQLEKEIIYWLVSEWEPVALSQLKQNILLPIFLSDLVAALESLERRCLIEKAKPVLLEKCEALFTLHPILMNYVKKQLVGQAFTEIRELMRSKSFDKVFFLKRYNFTKNPKNKIIVTVKDKLNQINRNSITFNKIIELIAVLTDIEQYRTEVGYIETNLKNLLVEVQVDLNEP